MNLSRAVLCYGLAVLTLALPLYGCGDDGGTPLPEGPQVLTGTLLPAEISLLRRGTHLLRIADTDTYYVESTHENLSKYEQKVVVVEGTLSKNVESSFLPVLDVLRVIDVLGDTLKEWHVRSLDLTLSVPDAWSGQVTEGKAIFTAPGSSEPVVRIERTSSGTTVDLSGGTPVVIGNTRAIRVTDEATGKQMVAVSRDEETIVFFFMPGDHSHPTQLKSDWLALLNTVSFNRENTIPDTGGTTGSGSVAGGPCGGTAGILCPAGYYCDVTNLQENIGTCKRL